MDLVDQAIERLHRTTEESYCSDYPAAHAAVDAVFSHKKSTARREDYVFDRIVRPQSEGADHRVVYEPKEIKRGSWDVCPISFDVFEKDNGWSVKDKYVRPGMIKSEG